MKKKITYPKRWITRQQARALHPELSAKQLQTILKAGIAAGEIKAKHGWMRCTFDRKALRAYILRETQ